MTWILGDVSGSETLTAQDHLYESHINQLRESNNASAVVGTTANCQYVCDGVADEVQINAAITAVNTAGGGIVHLKPGTYVTAADISMKSNVILQGEGEATIIQLSVAGTRLNCSGINNFKIRSLKIDTTGKSSGNNLEHTIRIFNCQNFEITSCHLEVYAFGIFMGSAASVSPVQACQNGFVHHNYIHGPCRNDLIGGGKVSADSPATQHISVHHNYVVQDQTMSGFQSYYTAFDMVPVNGITFENNHIWGTVVFGSEQDPHTDSSISKNWVYPPLNSTTVPATIMIDDGVQTTSQSSNLDIEGNFLYGGWIRVRGTVGQRVTKVRIRGNTVINDATLVTSWLGIVQRGISLTEVDQALIENNILDAHGATSTTGIFLSDSGTSIVQGNIIKSYTTGIEEAEINSTAVGNVVGPNTFVSTTNNYGTLLLSRLGSSSARIASVIEQFREIEASTAGSGAPNILLGLGETGKALTNEGAVALNYHTLPTAATGLRYTFIIQDGDGIIITANTGDTIRIGSAVSASAGNISSTTIGNAVTLQAINATEWIATSVVGTWTVT